LALIGFTDRNSAGGALGGGDGWRKRPSLAGKIWVERGFCCPVGELDGMDATRKSGLQKRLFCFPVKRRLALGAQSPRSIVSWLSPHEPRLSPLTCHAFVCTKMLWIPVRGLRFPASSVRSEPMPTLFSPLTIKSITLRNRIGVSPMCMYSADDGVANDWHLVHLGARAVGGAGLIIAEATGVSPEGRISPACAGLWAEKHIEPLARVARFVQQYGAVAGIQLAHAGRKASVAEPWNGNAQLEIGARGWDTIAPSAIAFGGNLPKVPQEMTLVDIARVQGDFVAAAKRALAAGFEWLEIHSAHGYLSHEFLSPFSNQRRDAYGGAFSNRVRFLVETIRQVRAVWPERLPLTVRLSCTDWVEGGWTLDESVELVRILRHEGVDLIDCSSGGSVHAAKIPTAPGFQVPFAERIKRETGIATATVGLITEAKQADDIIQSGRADIVLLGRELLRNPNWPLRAARALGQAEAAKPPLQYLRGW